MDEEWMQVDGFEVYEVSDLGRVRRGKKILKLELTRNGYNRVKLCGKKARKRFLVHRLVAITFIGISAEKQDVNHIDGNKTNNILQNLEWATKSENIIHSLKNGLRKQARGERMGSSKLKEADVLDIKLALKKPYRGIMNRLSEKYGVTQSIISRINSGHLWSHVILEDT